MPAGSMETRQILEIISRRIVAGGDDQSITLDLESMGIAAEKIPSLIATARHKTGIRAPAPSSPTAPAHSPAAVTRPVPTSPPVRPPAHVFSPPPPRLGTMHQAPAMPSGYPLQPAAAPKSTGYISAGKLYRFFGWLQIVAAAFIGLLGMIATLADSPTDDAIAGGVMMIFLAVFIGLVSYLQLKIGAALLEHKNWARTVGIIFALLQLFNFPIGTLIGLLVLYWLIQGWD